MLKRNTASQRTQLFLRLSKLRYNTLPGQVKTSAARGITKEQLLQFCDGSFIDKGQNILITESTGCGKKLPRLCIRTAGLYAWIQNHLLCHEQIYRSTCSSQIKWYIYQVAEPDSQNTIVYIGRLWTAATRT